MVQPNCHTNLAVHLKGDLGNSRQRLPHRSKAPTSQKSAVCFCWRRSADFDHGKAMQGDRDRFWDSLSAQSFVPTAIHLLQMTIPGNQTKLHFRCPHIFFRASLSFWSWHAKARSLAFSSSTEPSVPHLCIRILWQRICLVYSISCFGEPWIFFTYVC